MAVTRGRYSLVAFIDRKTGKLPHTDDKALPLDRPEAVAEFFDQIARRGFEMVPQLRTAPMRDSKTP